MRIRNCGWSEFHHLQSAPPKTGGKVSNRPVWARRDVVSMVCPKSAISAKSLEMLERFGYWKACGGGSLMNEEAKVAESILFLNEQWIEEQEHGKAKE